jgi:hypothetical protein
MSDTFKRGNYPERGNGNPTKKVTPKKETFSGETKNRYGFVAGGHQYTYYRSSDDSCTGTVIGGLVIVGILGAG